MLENKKMQEYQKRVIQEKNDLDEKLNGLYVFLNSDASDNLDGKDKTLLVEQSCIMASYLAILKTRIGGFNVIGAGSGD